MEPVSPHEGGGGGGGGDGSKIGKFTDAGDLDDLQLDLNELDKVMSAFPQEEPTNFNIQPNHSHINNTHHLTSRQKMILDDFDEFEAKMLPPARDKNNNNVATANHSVTNSTRTTYDLAREIEESRVMIEEMADDDHDHQGSSSSTFVLGNSNDSTENLNIDIAFDDDDVCFSDISGGSGIDPFFDQAYSYGLEGDFFQGLPSMTFYGGPSPSVRYFICSQNSNGGGSGKVSDTHRKKRRYKGVVETEEEIARRVERTKIKNREAAARAHQRKQAHEAHLQTLLLKLRKKNGFLKNMVMFLQGHKRADIHPQPQPLRRTISGPI
ncbi:hypothetical protein ACH5RR_017396 [Cinchona calisaya]|uniref:BZIP domain-containing protein n=1 Tax=Cinchona calisaya TaxID=153742 RepID=A0ABD2ZLD9_9GENT